MHHQQTEEVAHQFQHWFKWGRQCKGASHDSTREMDMRSTTTNRPPGEAVQGCSNPEHNATWNRANWAAEVEFYRDGQRVGKAVSRGS